MVRARSSAPGARGVTRVRTQRVSVSMAADRAKRALTESASDAMPHSAKPVKMVRARRAVTPGHVLAAGTACAPLSATHAKCVRTGSASEVAPQRRHAARAPAAARPIAAARIRRLVTAAELQRRRVAAAFVAAPTASAWMRARAPAGTAYGLGTRAVSQPCSPPGRRWPT
jgi:hypothetical protein